MKNLPKGRGFVADMSKWDPLRDLLSIQERVNRLFEETPGIGRPPGEGASGCTWSPIMDVYETEKEFLVKAEVPEVKQPDIEIKVRDNMLTIEGERRLQRTLMEGYHRIERAHGRFRRSFLLPGSVDQDNITATLKDGILKIVLPKKSNAVKKQIEID